MQDIRYLNLFSRISRVNTKFCFMYNNTLIFCVPRKLIYKAIGRDGKNVKKLNVKDFDNVILIDNNSNVKTIIVDHHLLRDINYKENFRNVFSHGEHVGVKVLTAARFMGMKERLLEARRKELKEK